MSSYLDTLINDISLLQDKLNDIRDNEFAKSFDDDVDYEKSFMLERTKILEEQQREFNEAYRESHQSLLKVKKDIYKFKQKIKYTATAADPTTKITQAASELDLLIPNIESISSDDVVIEILTAKMEKQKKQNQEIFAKILEKEMKLEIDLLSTVTVSQSVNRKSVPPPIAASNEQENRSNEAPVVHNLSLSKKGFLLKRGGKKYVKMAKKIF